MNILGIDIGGTKILGIRADEHGTVLDQVSVLTLAAEGLEQVVGRIAGVIQRLLPPGGVQAIGIASPGPLDPVMGMVYNPPNLPGWVAVPLREILQSRVGDAQPFVFVNDANAGALSEFRFGAGSEQRLGRKIRHLVYLTISTGIGGGVIIDGKLLVGANGYAAELGHLVIDAFGNKQCNCGNTGCLEAIASGTALTKEAARVVASGQPGKITELAEGDPAKVNPLIVEQAARMGDPVALELWQQEGMLVGVGVVTCIHAFNPEVVVLGGGISNAGDLLFDPVIATVKQRVMAAFHGTYEILPAALKGESGALGAVAAALEAIGA